MSMRLSSLEKEKIEEEKLQKRIKPNVSANDETINQRIFVVDQDLLNCPICCYRPLRPPIYQCNSGHVVCESCYKKINGKCPSCSSPMGSNRCIAIEKIVESATILCMYWHHGCMERLSYLKILKHEKTCEYTPISCPERDCEFIGAPQFLYTHFAEKHQSLTIPFTFNTPRYVYMSMDGRSHKLLQESREETLFVLHRVPDPLGSFVNVTCVAPTASNMKFSYEVTAKMGENSINQKFASMELTPDCCVQPPKEKCVLIMNNFRISAASTQLFLELVIRKIS